MDDDREDREHLRNRCRKSDKQKRRSDMPRSMRYFHKNSCLNKVRFRDEEEAKSHVRNIARKLAEKANGLRIYFCNICRGYHTTSLQGEKDKLNKGGDVTFRDELEALGGFWQYKVGGKYLALLASGKISDVFCNTGILTTYPDKLEIWGMKLARELREHLPHGSQRSLSIIGPGMGGITLAYELARYLHADTGTRSFFTEPVEADGVKSQKFRFDLPVCASVLLVEDVITTGGSVQKTINAVSERGFTDFIPVVACLVDRRSEKGKLVLDHPHSSKSKIELQVVSLLDICPRTWNTLEAASADCPSVIEAIKPKGNWSKLVEG